MKNPFKGYKWHTWIIILFKGFLVLSRLAPTFTPLFSGGSGPSRSETATVVRVIVDDAIGVDLDGWRYTVRYIGINTPEIYRPSRGVEFYGPEASARNRELVEGKTVRMELDVSSTDRFDRLLRYVYVDDEIVRHADIRRLRSSVSLPARHKVRRQVREHSNTGDGKSSRRMGN